MKGEAFRRLRARGTVVIEADADGFHVSWWPAGQKGNPFCSRGGRCADLAAMDDLLVQIEADTRPPWYPNVESVKLERIRQAERERHQRQRTALFLIDKADRKRERYARQSEEFRRRREGDELRRRRSA